MGSEYMGRHSLNTTVLFADFEIYLVFYEIHIATHSYMTQRSERPHAVLDFFFSSFTSNISRKLHKSSLKYLTEQLPHMYPYHTHI